MTRFFHKRESDSDRLLAGATPREDDHAELAWFLADVRAAYPETPTDALEPAHLALIAEAVHLLTQKHDPVASPAVGARLPAEQESGPRKPSTISLRHRRLSSTVKVAAGTAALVIAFAGVAFAGAFPDGMQNALAGAADAIGISLPRAGTEPTTSTTVVGAPADAATSTTAATLATTVAEPERTVLQESADVQNDDEHGENEQANQATLKQDDQGQDEDQAQVEHVEKDDAEPADVDEGNDQSTDHEPAVQPSQVTRTTEPDKAESSRKTDSNSTSDSEHAGETGD